MKHFLKCCLFALAVASLCLSQTVALELRVNETAARIDFTSSSIRLTLPLEKAPDKTTKLLITLKLLDPENRTRASSNTLVVLHPRQRSVGATLDRPFQALKQLERNDLAWYRIAYEIRTELGAVLASGILPISTGNSDIFRLVVAAPGMAVDGRTYSIHVNAANTHSLAPVRAVQLRGELTWDDENGQSQKAIAQGATDGAGEASLKFILPARLNRTRASVVIVGNKGAVSRSVQEEIALWPASVIMVDTDKDIYQPGQTLHVRALMFDAARNARAGASLNLRITDEQDTLLFRDALVTDKFGVASADWTIPSTLRLGTYHVDVADSREESVSSSQWVHIYRYDLPNFSVTAKPDHAYYLPGQNAVVTVSAEYLFGKPVKHATVRLVEEEDRRWNFREQKWEIEEGQVRSGELDKEGRFTTTLVLQVKHEELKGRSYQRFQDVNFGAYVTDLTTGRTEQRRVALRVTREPIHVYINVPWSVTKGLPEEVLVSTFYADGTPARCTVRINEGGAEDERKDHRYLLTVKTNQYGIAKINNLDLGKDHAEGRSHLLAEARDSRGLAGIQSEEFRVGSESAVRLTTTHNIYRPGESIEVFLQASERNQRVVVDLVRDSQLLASQTVNLRSGRGLVVFPFDDAFTDEIGIVAYSPTSARSAYDFPVDQKVVLFPRNHRLETRVRFQRASYRPGDTASASLQVVAPGGAGVESALGIKIVDKAVEERSRTDREFSGPRYRWRRWWPWSSGASFAGITREDLDLIDTNRPISPDLDLVAGLVLSRSGGAGLQVEFDGSEGDPEKVFSRFFDLQFKPLQAKLLELSRTASAPRDLAGLREVGLTLGVDLQKLSDPWGTPYRYIFEIDRTNVVVEVRSAGPDKKFDTKDDFEALKLRWDYFSYYGALFDKAADLFLNNQGRFIRDRATLRAQLLPLGVDLDELRDPWGHLYRYSFDTVQNSFVIAVSSGGRNWDGHAPLAAFQEVQLWSKSLDYFAVARRQIYNVLFAYAQKTGSLPASEHELKALLLGSGVELDSLHDPFGGKYYFSFKSVPEYDDTVVFHPREGSLEKSPVPSALLRHKVFLMSPGADGIAYTSDDFAVAEYSNIVSLHGARDFKGGPNPDTGRLKGTVLDPQGAVVSGARIKVTDVNSGVVFTTQTNSVGEFLLSELQSGLYRLEVSAQGFKTSVLTSLAIQPAEVTEVKITLAIGEASTTVEVSAEAPSVETTQATVSQSAKPAASSPRANVAGESHAMSTPRLRQYFPETLLWEPALITDRHGRARLNFKLADNITTWKLSTVASTRTGELGRAEVDLRAFQPFFLEHDPPRILTQGDVIDYAVVLRNYLENKQTVAASMQPEKWFTLLGPPEQSVTIPSGDAASAVFRYRAAEAIANGKQRVSAANARTSDAAEKPLDVHPFGRLDSQTDTELLYRSGALNVAVPGDAIAGSLTGELKVYPSLLAHVVESVEAVLERPHGCGEQTISSTYPSVLVVQFYAGAGGAEPPIAQKARRYVQAGYERLLGYQSEDGGFSYWGHGDSDLALTAYAISFLSNASQLIDIDPSKLADAKDWLRTQQQLDGSWRRVKNTMDGDVTQTAYIARILAEAPDTKPAASNAEPEAIKSSIAKAMKFLATHRGTLEPYASANYALAALAMGDNDAASVLVGELRRTARHVGGMAYWELASHTPFYSWGRTGRLESTALAVRALAKFAALNANSRDKSGDDELVRQGLLFLLRNKDSGGIWYSGQTTVTVLQTLLSLLPRTGQDAALPVGVIVNGNKAATLDLPGSLRAAAPLVVDLQPYLKPGGNRVELEIPTGAAPISAQLIANYYVPWPADDSKETKKAGEASVTPRLEVSYSKTRPQPGETVSCRVRAQRTGNRGYGMMVGEIGLPPGADVDRESLENAVKNDWSIDQYDVLPDRVLVYLWPRAGVVEFTFNLKLRFAIDAETAPSQLYDYYNPDAVVQIKPVRFQNLEAAAK